MKTFFSAMTFIALTILFAVPNITFAQVPDTVVVSAYPVGNINNFIMADTNSTGGRANPNRVYILHRDSIYYFTGLIKLNFNLTMIAEPGTGTLPVLEPAILSNNSRSSTFIDIFSGNLSLKQIYFSNFAPDGIPTASARTIIVTGDNSKIKIDSCIFDGMRSAAIWGGGKNNSYWITDNIFRNMQDYLGFFGADTWMSLGTANPIDTVYFVNNTVFCSGGYAFYSNFYSGYTNFSHNTVYLNDVAPLGIFNTTNGVFDNNIFYGVDAGGYTAPGGGGNSIMWFHTLLSNVGTLYNITEAQRRVEVKNNAYFWPQTIQNIWKTYNDTSSHHRYPPVFMDSLTTTMFQDTTFLSVKKMFISDTLVSVDTSYLQATDTSFVADTTIMSDTTIIVNRTKLTKWYPNFEESGNINTDPGFSSSILGQVDSLAKYVWLYLGGGLKTYIWWYNPTGTLAPPTLPVPENLAYSNTTLQNAGTDGFALGDLNWFPQQHQEWLGNLTGVNTSKSTVPTGYALKQNYPNPFNPSTIISYSIPKEARVVLKIYNILGQEVSTLVNQNQIAGNYKVSFNASSLSSGVYFYTLRSGDFVQSKKLVLLK